MTMTDLAKKIKQPSPGSKEAAVRELREAEEKAGNPPVPTFLKRTQTDEEKRQHDLRLAMIRDAAEQRHANKALAAVTKKEIAGAVQAGAEYLAKSKPAANAATQEKDMTTKKPAAKKAAAKKTTSNKPARVLRPDGLVKDSGMAKLVDTVCRAKGATNAELCEAVGWAQCLPMMKKACEKAGVKLRVEKEEGKPTRYFGTPKKAPAAKAPAKPKDPKPTSATKAEEKPAEAPAAA